MQLDLFACARPVVTRPLRINLQWLCLQRQLNRERCRWHLQLRRWIPVAS